MPTFPSKPYVARGSRKAEGGTFGKLVPSIRKRPFLLFGLPFTLTIVGAAYGLSYLTQTRYEYNSTKVSSLSKQEELGMKKDRRKIDLREEYFKLSQGAAAGSSRGGSSGGEDVWEEWEPKRVPRPEGVEEWGVGPAGASGTYVEEAANTRSYKGKKRDTGKVYAEAADSQDPLPSAGSASPVGAGSRGNRTVITASGQKVIIGPDGKPCRACNSRLAFADAMRGTGGSSRAGGSSSNSVPSIGSGMAAFAGAAAAGSASAAQSDAEASLATESCPPDVEELGRSTWDMLHSVAAVYPDSPTPEQRSALLSLLTSLPILYPCGTCAEALGLEYERRAAAALKQSSPPNTKSAELTPSQATQSKAAATKFMCSIHNEVNGRLGKPLWDCDDLAKLKARWEDGGARCY